MAKHVKGVLFLDYVRMIRKRKEVDWDRYLTAEDRDVLARMILPSQWYPLETYQRCGVAVLHEIAAGDVQVVRSWGRQSMDELIKIYKNLIKSDDALDSLKKFQVLRSRFFDFEAVQVKPGEGKKVEIKVDTSFGGVADEAYAYQMLGSFERFLELSGAKNIQHRFLQKAWEGAADSVIELGWK